MRMTKPAPPAEIMSALRTGLADFAEPTDQLAASLLEQYEAHRVHTLGLNHLELPDPLSKAEPVGWRFMAAGPASDLGCHVGGTTPKLTGLTRAPEIHVLIHRLRQLDEHTQKPSGEWAKVPDQDYELRALRIPGLLIEALWLHCPKAKQNDRVVPFAGFLENSTGPAKKWTLNLMQPYPPKDFFDKIKDAAKYRRDSLHALHFQDFQGNPEPQP